MDSPSSSSCSVIVTLPVPQTVPVFVVRVAGLPLEVLRGLRFDETIMLIDELLERREWVRTEGERLSDLLYLVVGTVQHKPTRYKLLALRRDVYHGRCPKPRDTDHDVMAALPADVGRALDRWLAQLHQYRAVDARLEATVAHESARKRLQLRRACADPGFQCGLVLASREFFAEVAKWLAAVPRPDPNLESTLTKYLARAAAKTSPFSTLTSTGYGQWSQHGYSPLEYNPAWSRRSMVELNLLVTHAIAEAVSAWPEVRPSLVMRANPSLVDDGDAARFLVHRRDDSVVVLTMSPTVRRVLDAVDGCRGRRRRDVVRLLTDMDPEGREKQISAFLDRLVTIGLLEARLPITDQSPDHLADLQEFLGHHSGARIEALRDSVHELRGLLVDYARHDMPAARSVCAEKIGGVVDGITQNLAIPAGLVPRKNVFYEDTVTDVGVRIPAVLWDALREDIGLLHRLAAVYDMSLPTSLTTTEFFTTHYGRGATRDVLTFFGDFSARAKPPSSRLVEITSLQRRLAAEVVGHPVDPDGVRRLDPALVRAVLEQCPNYVEQPRTLTLHCQLLDVDGAPSIVLNDLYRGRSRSLARQLRLCGTVGVTDVHPEPASPVYTDVTGATGTNLELRAPLIPYEITYPGGVSGRPAHQRIPLGELDVVHDPVTNRLRLVQRGTGRRLTPQHLGTTAIFLLPPMNQFLLDAFGEASYVYVRQGLSGLAWRSRTSEVELIPRLCLGRIVINRAKWVASRDDVPRRTGTLAATGSARPDGGGSTASRSSASSGWSTPRPSNGLRSRASPASRSMWTSPAPSSWRSSTS